MRRIAIYAAIIGLLVLIAIGLRTAWVDLTHGIRLEGGYISATRREYRHAPGCSPGVTADNSLPPCTTVPATVVDITSTSYKGNKTGILYTRMTVTLRDNTGQTEAYSAVDVEFLRNRRLGETITEKCWRGRVMELLAGRDTYSPPWLPMSSSATSRVGEAQGWLVFSVIVAPLIIVILWRYRDPPGVWDV
ncbi:MAG: hypothetical protein ACLQVD_04970 [Capsulimonadaceae bacterium]